MRSSGAAGRGRLDRINRMERMSVERRMMNRRDNAGPSSILPKPTVLEGESLRSSRETAGRLSLSTKPTALEAANLRIPT